MDNEIIYLKSDLAFKLVFGREDDARCKYVLKNLLESILNIEINEIKYKNPINLGESIDAKQTEFDISLTIEDKHNCDIEIQLRNHKAFNDRLVYYGATVLTEGIKADKSYEKMKKAIIICLADFVMFGNEDTYKHEFIMKERTGNYVLSDIIEVVVLEMPKADCEKAVCEMSGIEKWLIYLKYGGDARYSGKLDEIQRESEAIEMAEQIFNEAKSDEQARSALLSRQRYQKTLKTWEEQRLEEGFEQGLEKGLAKGLEQGKLEMVRNMLRANISIDVIKQVSGLTDEEILALKQNNL